MPLKVYYIDDEQELCEAFVDYFTSVNVVITTFDDPTLAIEAINVNPPDLLFIDYRLPGTTGERVAISIDPNIPKFLITGDIAVNPEYPFLRIFSKPFAEQEIAQIIETFAAKKKAA